VSRGQVAVIVALALLAGGCSATARPGRPAAESRKPAQASTSSGTRAAGRGRDPFSVRGSVPVQPNASQDTRAQAAGAGCRPAAFRQDVSLGQATATGFTVAGAPVAAQLLRHFLAGTGTAVAFGAGSAVAREARVATAFRALNRQVQAAVASQLRAGRSRVRLAAPVLAPVRFGLPGSTQDLYLGFRGTQGLTVRGSGRLVAGAYAGQLTYVIEDSYGFPPQDKLLGIGTAMRYLQVNCGSPATRGGARWFPDSITVTVPFRQPSAAPRGRAAARGRSPAAT